MPTLDDLFDPLDFQAALEGGYINVKRHPTASLWIANYTPQTQYEKAWNPVTMQCRGLIFGLGDVVVSRPFPKFFNLGEEHVDNLPDGQIRVQEKLDGSLGIVYRVPGRVLPSIATRGSFESDQARHATNVLHTRYLHFEPVEGFTYLFEIIYPENRIVVDYGREDNLYLLDIIDNETGRSALDNKVAAHAWKGPRTHTYDFKSVTEVLEQSPVLDRNREGFVVHFAKDETRVKIKFAEYVRLHQLITATSARTLWEFLAVNACKHLIEDPNHWGSFVGIDPARVPGILAAGENWLAPLLETVPDEFYTWVRATVEQIETAAAEMEAEARDVAERAALHGISRRALFEYVKEHPMQKEIMRLVTQGKGNYLTLKSWRSVEPEYARPFWIASEDVA